MPSGRKNSAAPTTAAKPATKTAAKAAKVNAKPNRLGGPLKRSSRNRALPHARVPVDDALRATGLGELRFAETLGLFIERVSDKKGQEKLLLDGLKEWGRQFERTRPAERPGERGADAPVVVQLIHNVPRPERSERAAASKTPPEFPPARDPQKPPKPPTSIIQ